MLNHSSLSSSEPLGSPLPDPWEDIPTRPRHKLWQLQRDRHPLLAPTEHPDTLLGVIESPTLLRLKGLKIRPLDVLLQDGLKLGMYRQGELETQLENALTLLVWSGAREQSAIA